MPQTYGGFQLDLGGKSSTLVPGPSAIFLRLKYNPATFANTLDVIVAGGQGNQGGKGSFFGIPNTSINNIVAYQYPPERFRRTLLIGLRASRISSTARHEAASMALCRAVLALRRADRRRMEFAAPLDGNIFLSEKCRIGFTFRIIPLTAICRSKLPVSRWSV